MQSQSASASGLLAVSSVNREMLENELPGPPYSFLDSKQLIRIVESLGDKRKLFPCIPDGLKENRYYIVDNSSNLQRHKKGLKGNYKDDSGPWNLSKSHSVMRYYLQGSLKSIELKGDIYCVETKRLRKRTYAPLNPQPDSQSVYALHCHYVKHKLSESYKRRITWFSDLPIAFYEYCGNAPKDLKDSLDICSTAIYDNIYCLEVEEGVCETDRKCLSLVINEYPNLKEAVSGYAIPDISLDICTMMDTLKTGRENVELLHHVPIGLKENVYFLMDASMIVHCKDFVMSLSFFDDCGPWDFEKEIYEVSLFLMQSDKSLKCLKVKDGLYCHDGMDGPIIPQPDAINLVKIHRCKVSHRFTKSYSRQVTWIENDGKKLGGIAFLEYLGRAPEKLKQEMNEKSANAHNTDVPSAVILPLDDPFEDELPETNSQATFLPLLVILEKFRCKVTSLKPLAHVPRGFKENQHYIVDNSSNVQRHKKGRKCTFWDDCGPWTSHFTVTVTYLFEHDKVLKKVVNKNGKLCTEHKVNGEKVCIPLDPQPYPEDVIVFHRSSAKHKESDEYRRRITWLKDGTKDLSCVACYEYCGRAPESLRETLANIVIGISETRDLSQGDNNLTQWTTCPNGGFMLPHPGGKFLDLYEVISVLQMAGIESKPLDTVPTGVKENQFFVVCNKFNTGRHKSGYRNVFWDDCGTWNSNCTKVNTDRYLCGPNQKLTRVLDVQGEFCIERYKDGIRMYIPLDPQPDPNTLLVIHRNFSKHSLSKHYQRKVTWIENQGDEFPDIACYEYLGKFPGHQPHKGCKKNFKNYIRSRESATVQGIKVKQSFNANDQSIHNDVCSDDNVELEEISSIQEDLFVQVNKSGKKLIYDIMDMVETHSFVQMATTTKNRQLSVVLYTEEQLLDIRRFCCYSALNEIAVLSFSVMHDICGSTLIISAFRNIAVIRDSDQQCPVFPGPMYYIHQEADHTSYFQFFSHLAAELGEHFPHLVVILEGKEMQHVFKQVFSNEKSLASFNLMQVALMNCFKNCRNIPTKKIKIIKDLCFGDQGIVNEKDSVKFFSLIGKVQCLCDEIGTDVGINFKSEVFPQLKRNFEIIENLGLPATVLKHANSDCNSFKDALMMQMKSLKSAELETVIRDIYGYVNRLYADVEKSLHGEGNFTLCQEFQTFLRSGIFWKELNESKRRQHFRSFLCETKKKNGNGSKICDYSQVTGKEFMEFMDTN